MSRKVLVPKNPALVIGALITDVTLESIL